MGLLPSNPMVHLSVIVRALTSLISISGGSGGSVPSTERQRLVQIKPELKFQWKSCLHLAEALPGRKHLLADFLFLVN